MLGVVAALMFSVASPAQVASPERQKELLREINSRGTASQTKTEAPLHSPAPPPVVESNGVSIYFSPRGGCTEAIVGHIKSAKESVRVMAYSFTSAPIAEAILAAKLRGVVVDVVLDKSQATQQYSAATFLHNQGVTPLIDGTHAIQHNKVIIIDERVVITGSFNFSAAAEEKNAENLVIFGNHEEIAAVYTEEFLNHAQHSAQYIGFRQPLVEAKPTPGESAAEKKTNKQPADDPTVYVTRTGSKYHRSGCRHTAKSGSPTTKSAAIARGLGPCGTCKP